MDEILNEGFLEIQILIQKCSHGLANTQKDIKNAIGRGRLEKTD
jgi:hypothetical protein